MNILMPQLGETVAEGKITKWFKAAGDAVKPGDNLFEIETDKTSMEVPATMAGVLTEVRVGEGVVVPVGAVVAVLSSDGAPVVTSSPATPPNPAKAAIVAAASAVAATHDAFRVTPSAPTTLDPWNAVRTPEKNF